MEWTLIPTPLFMLTTLGTVLVNGITETHLVMSNEELLMVENILRNNPYKV